MRQMLMAAGLIAGQANVPADRATRYATFQSRHPAATEIRKQPRVQAARNGRRDNPVDPSGAKLWNEMLDEFRALGGTAENVCLRNGRFGRGLFPQDPAKPVAIRIPDSLLVESRHVCIDNGAFRLDAEAPVGKRERRFLENYQRDFSWGVAHHETEGLLQMFHAAPPELRELLHSPFNLHEWLQGPTPQAVLSRFVESRAIHYRNRAVMMPIVELANHGLGTYYETDDGVGLSGRFDDEVLVSYQSGDPLMLFRNWGFVSTVESFALSLTFGVRQGALRIKRKDLRLENGRPPFYPEVEKEGEGTTLSYLLLGHKRYPRIARGVFYRVASEAGFDDAPELFDHIQHVNRTQFLHLAELSETAAPRLGRLLRGLAYAQLQLMSFNIGAREP
jgi:hypothetical protein